MMLFRARRSFCSGEKRITSGPVTKRSYQLMAVKRLQTLDWTAVEAAVRSVSPTPRTETARRPPVATMDAPEFLTSQGSGGFAGLADFGDAGGAVSAEGAGAAPGPACVGADCPATEWLTPRATPRASPQASVSPSRCLPKPRFPHARNSLLATSFKGSEPR